MPQQLIKNAEKQLKEFRVIKSDIDTKVMRVHEAVEEVRKTIKSNLFDKVVQAGHLTRKEGDYLACLEMKHV